MTLMTKFCALGLLAMCSVAAFNALPASAATPLVNMSGKLTGARGVIVNGTSYDVAFRDGTCTAVFNGCDGTDFAFKSFSEGISASRALLAQVFVDGHLGNFNSDPNSTNGCAQYDFCQVIIPVSVEGSRFNAVVLQNLIDSDDDDATGSSLSAISSFDTTDLDYYTYSRFSLTSAGVPELATWGMMMLGFGVMGASVRYRRQNAKTSSA